MSESRGISSISPASFYFISTVVRKGNAFWNVMQAFQKMLRGIARRICQCFQCSAQTSPMDFYSFFWVNPDWKLCSYGKSRALNSRDFQSSTYLYLFTGSPSNSDLGPVADRSRGPPYCEQLWGRLTPRSHPCLSFVCLCDSILILTYNPWTFPYSKRSMKNARSLWGQHTCQLKSSFSVSSFDVLMWICDLSLCSVKTIELFRPKPR